MSYYWLIITLSWFGSVRLQYIPAGETEPNGFFDTLDSSIQFPPIPYLNTNPQLQNDHETYQNEDTFYLNDERPPDLQRKKRNINDKEEVRNKRWLPNLLDTEKTMYLKNHGKVGNPFLIQAYTEESPENITELLQAQKRSFSPWGGKRSPDYEQMWSWKRAMNLQEPSMPKRVRFSPWGGKRSGQMIYKPSNKDSKIIFSTSVPELTKIVSSYSPAGGNYDLAGFRLIPALDKRAPIKMLALSTRVDDNDLKNGINYNKLIEALPRIFKSGHPYFDVNLKKDGKRKMKFSAWGGKRSPPPIIGPIWTPAPENVKESTLDAILLIRNRPRHEKMTSAS